MDETIEYTFFRVWVNPKFTESPEQPVEMLLDPPTMEALEAGDKTAWRVVLFVVHEELKKRVG